LASVPADTPLMFGASDNYGVQIVRRNDAIEVFPRMCPHEGACLDQKSFKERSISCCWHGRRFAPIVRIPLPAQATEFVGPFHRFVVSADELRILPVAVNGDTAEADWTATIVPRTTA